MIATDRRRPITGDESGFTLIELVVTMTLATIVLFAILQGADVFAQTTKRADDVTKAQDAARSTMRQMVATIRESRLPKTAAEAKLTTVPTTPIRVADASSGDVVIATGTATAAGWTRFCADGSGSLIVGRLATSTYADPGVCGADSNGWVSGKALDRTLLGARSDLFQFSSGSCVAGQPVGAGAVCPPAANTITTVGITLSIAGSPGSTTTGATMRNAVSVRNGSPR